MNFYGIALVLDKKIDEISKYPQGSEANLFRDKGWSVFSVGH